jgi:hypothetical protein
MARTGDEVKGMGHTDASGDPVGPEFWAAPRGERHGEASIPKPVDGV